MDPDITIEDSDHSDNGDEEAITAQKVFEILELAWLNERSAPELLPHQSEILDLMLGQISHMEANMSQLDRNDFRSIAHRMELERIRYIVASYLRNRLAKIEMYGESILGEDATRNEDSKYLSESETVFAQAYVENMNSHFNHILLRHIPESFHDDPKKRMVKPNLMSTVFVRVNSASASVVINEEDEELEMRAGSQHVVPYKLISDLLRKNKLQLL